MPPASHFQPRRFCHVHGLTFATVALFCAAFGPLSAKPKKDAAPPPSEVVEMEGLTVTDARELPPPEEWSYTTIPGFEVLSNASTRATQRLMRDFVIFRDALGIVWPIQFRDPPPSAIILCGRNNAFEQFLPAATKEDGTPVDIGRASITLINREQGFIVMDLQTKSLDLDPSMIGMESPDAGPASFEIDHYAQLYREYVRYLLSQFGASLPPWFEEGLCQIIMKMDVDKRTIIFGKIDDPDDYPSPRGAGAGAAAAPLLASDDEDSGDSSDPGFIGNVTIDDRDFNIVLRRRALLNFKDFFGVKADSPVAQNPLGNNVWAKQCQAFVHMCLFSTGGKYKKPFAEFLARSAKEPVTPELFKECFGKTYNRFLVELRGYISFTSYTAQQVTITSGPPLLADPPEMRVAGEGVSARIKGDALMIAGKPQAALNTLRAASIRGDQTAPLLASLGIAAHAAGEDTRARKALEAAVAGQTTRGRAYTTLARIHLSEAQGELSPSQLSSILQLLFEARKIRPTLPDTYELIAEAWTRSSASPKDEHLAVLVEGIKRFPRDVELVYQTAELATRIANYDGARSLIAHGLKITTDTPVRERFAKLQSTLPSPPMPAEPPPSAVEPSPVNTGMPASAPAS